MLVIYMNRSETAVTSLQKKYRCGALSIEHNDHATQANMLTLLQSFTIVLTSARDKEGIVVRVKFNISDCWDMNVVRHG